jgi:diguanylate cyclase (GGDEF)-like protein/PAS domain S-box-containing protein
MKKSNKLDDGHLRRQTEAKLSKLTNKKSIQDMNEADILRLLHELQVRQIELEMQNEQLLQAQADQTLSQSTLERALGQYTDLYDFAPVGYFTLMRNGVIHQINLAGAKLLGLNHREASQIRIAAIVSNASQASFKVFFENLLSGEGKETCELECEKKGGEVLWARIEASCFEGGNTSRAMLTDITERKLMEQALRESENRFRTTLQNAPTIAVQGYAQDGTTQYWNFASEKLYGYSAKEAIGKNLLDLIIPPEIRNEVRQAIQQMVETRQPIPPAELSLMHKDGSRVPVFSSHTVFAPPGRPVELFCLDVDLAEHKQAEALMQTRIRISDFADSHSLDEILQKTLDEAEILTGSQIGFAHFLEADQKTLTLQMWSTNTIKNMCTAEGKGSHYPVNLAGVWTDCVTTREPVIHNDYPNLPHRKGLPDGHAPVLRELIVPVLRNDRIMMILGVGNKPTNYNEKEVEIISQLANQAWDIIQRKRAEELLKESEWRNRIVSELTADYIFVVDVDLSGMLKLRWTSENMFRMTGRTIEDAATVDLWENIIHPEDRIRFFGFIKQILSTAEAGELECRSFYKLGGERWVWIFARPQVDMENRVTTIVGAVQDITERKQAEAALAESEKKFRALFETMSEGIVYEDHDGKIISANPAAERLLGISLDQMQGRTSVDPRWKAVHENGSPFPGENHSLNIAAKTGKPTTGEVMGIFNPKSDSYVWLSVNSTPEFLPGEMYPFRAYAVFRDITERKMTEEALKESESLYRKMNENSPLGMHFYKLNDKNQLIFTGANPAADKLLGVDNFQFIGKTIEEAFPQLTQTEVPERYRDTAAKGIPWSTEQITYSDDKGIAGAFDVRAFQTTPGNMVAIFADITERKQAEVELQQTKEGLEAANIQLQTALEREKQLAHTDVLTGINNRRYLYELAEREFEMSTRYQQPLSLMLFDIDHFKEVNDTFGHAVGDHILQRVTQVACDELRSTDIIGRYGGEEFVVILPMTKAQQAYSLAERIRSGVEAMFVPTEKGDAAVTLSIGIIEMVKGAQNGSAESLIRRADEAMYSAKQAGRNRTEIGK